ncbi:MAG: alcohol dehydrogenase [Candidatus Schekmanbacteria bacterium RIFCSPHIGHO2_02_FULL_38_11]|uniref:Alcohol dehydrogenase n=1 Tax=Candidatus Schekmanbacteria bacterium RIFCSPLOWO2_12_FULL_38_15 TaxID=1817883 RepID=A0A1F7SI83_9BACT|nr:MAG: alcohol dehydrogenase [Candidatus Schekmanbacteria bacterium GWA2_38_9]OGL50759.1 MAG: alcohol dehydrogenase [Candidatus Schekmanbacteria bacterium RIFCSPLOWO2_02_FULL_38_14]OGL53481.1 MAG: alcohol dehydrogenase [Candidatus Schekmanbacteria bacterium RIFCSPLOWO2_12_FULL_38_15]OGL54976.1 MAG: alcohol dehydrogenase [Candidatus Schekmanbacteria bacterium RIFCSPHIGHO2_02_FULL_38_11]
MRVAKYYNNKDIRIEEMPIPKIASGELLVKVIASGICGSDVMEWYRIKKAPLVLGHEIAGEVVEVGNGVKRFKVGDRVSVSHHVPCNTCHYCLNGNYSVCDTLRSTNFDPGGFSEYLRIPQINVDRGTFLLPDKVSYEDGTFAEPLACVLRGQRIAKLKPGHSVLVIGSGISGLLHIKLARALGAGKIIAMDINEYRLKSAKKFGADAVINAKEYSAKKLCEKNNGRLADIVILCAGAMSAIKQALQSADRGGTILFFAPTEPGVKIPVDMWNLWRDGITLAMSYAGPPEDTVSAIELIRAKRVIVSDMITHRLSLGETALGFKLVAEANESMKVIIEPQR